MNATRAGLISALTAATAFLGACAHAAETPKAPEASASQPAPATDPAKKPIVIKNPDGSVTIQKPADPEAPEKKKGLVIKPQVVKPSTGLPEPNPEG